MRAYKRSFTRLWAIAGLLAALVMLVTAPAVSADDPVSAEGDLTGVFTPTTSGSLTFAVNINGANKPTNPQSAGPTLTVSDFRDPAAGWQITAAATQFTTGGGTPLKLGMSALSVTGITSTTCTSGFTCDVNPTNTVTGYPLALAAHSPDGTVGTPVTIYTTAAGTGSFDIKPAFNLAITSADRAGTYTATITIAYINTGS